MYYADTVEARKLECDSPPIPKPREEGTPASIVPGPCSKFLESSVLGPFCGATVRRPLTT